MVVLVTAPTTNLALMCLQRPRGALKLNDLISYRIHTTDCIGVIRPYIKNNYYMVATCSTLRTL